MKKTIFLVGLVILATISQNPLIAVALDTGGVTKTEIPIELVEVKQPQLTNKQIVEGLVNKYSAQYGVSKVEMMRTLTNENDTFQFNRQSGLKYKAGNRWGLPAGSREQSFGVAQIHLPDHPKITKAQATDPDFAVEFMAKQFAKGNARMWMGYTKS